MPLNDNLESQAKSVFEKLDLVDTVPLSQFVNYQEGPGIRNWQFVDNGIPFVNIRCIQDGDLVLTNANKISFFEANGKYKHFMLNEWDVIISSSGTLGKNAIIRKEHLPLCLNTSIIRFTPKNSFTDFSFMLYFLRSRDFVNSLYSEATGSAQVNLGPMQLDKMTIILPSNDNRVEFHRVIFPIICSQESNKMEISVLRKLQQMLLSSLIH